MPRFTDKTILISGGARGQGASEARMLVAEGARVVIGDIRDVEGARLATELGENAQFVHHDVTSEADWTNAVQVAKAFGGLHGLVNNAGIFIPKPIMETDVALFEQHMRINQLGCFLGMRAVADLIENSGGGAIVNISSIAGLRGSPSAIAYGATKWALRGMTKTTALAFAPRSIRVNSVHPGFIDTEMLDIRPTEELQRLVAAIPMGRMAKADEVAELVLFLLSDQSRYITGAEIAIDGGASL